MKVNMSPEIEDLINSVAFYKEKRLAICYFLGKVFQRQHRLEREPEYGLKPREGSSKLQKWPFHDELWLRFVLKKKTRGGPYDISR